MLKFKTSEENQIWFSSDLHINHANICRATSNWSNKFSTRNFKSIKEMNNQILGNINYYVKENDILFLLGDLLFRWKTAEDYNKILEKINCKQIYILFGNHCRRDSLVECWENYNKPEHLSDVLYCQIDDRKVFMSHYAHRVWPESHHNSFHLYGHSHGSLPEEGKSMDVGVDAAFMETGEYRPYSWSEIKNKLDKRRIFGADYHNEETT